MDLTERVAFVTGGSGDIGRAIALGLATSGSDVVVSYFSEVSRAEAGVEAVRQTGRQAPSVPLDQRDLKSDQPMRREGDRPSRADRYSRERLVFSQNWPYDK